jgi:hypothetical protein
MKASHVGASLSFEEQLFLSTYIQILRLTYGYSERPESNHINVTSPFQVIHTSGDLHVVPRPFIVQCSLFIIIERCEVLGIWFGIGTSCRLL